jgi:hypothetical protein
MISILLIQTVKLISLIKDNAVHAGLIQELLNSVTDFAKIELMQDKTQISLFNIPQTLSLCAMPMDQTIMVVMEVI